MLFYVVLEKKAIFHYGKNFCRLFFRYATSKRFVSESFIGIRLARKFEQPVAQLRRVSDRSILTSTPIKSLKYPYKWRVITLILLPETPLSRATGLSKYSGESDSIKGTRKEALVT